MTPSQSHKQGLIGLYKSGWSSLIQNWRILLISHGINFLLVLLAIGPLSKVLKSNVSNSYFHDKIAGPFSYTLFMDLVNNHGEAIRSSLTLIGSTLVPFLLWSVFCSGGYMQLIKETPRRIELGEFWKGGANYFFRFLRLALYVLLILSVLAALCFMFFSSGGLNPLATVSESALINKFYLTIGVFAILYFLVSLFKEKAKAKIHFSSDHRLINRSIVNSFRELFSTQTIFLGLINLGVLLLVSLIYFGLKKFLGNALIPAVIVSQVFLVFRMACRYVKQASFVYLEANRSIDN